MTDPDAEFHQQLLAMFREEAEEHLGEITDELIALEKEGVQAGSPIVERMYRKTHSLKGSARAVSLREIESVCQNLESVFSLIKKGEFVPDEASFDLFHDAIKITRDLLSRGSTSGMSPAEAARSLWGLISAARHHQAAAPGRTPPASPPGAAEGGA